MFYPTLLLSLLAASHVQARICYQTVFPSRESGNSSVFYDRTVIEKETSDYCMIYLCGGTECASIPNVINAPRGINGRIYVQLTATSCRSPDDLSASYIPYWCCKEDRCNSIELMKAIATVPPRDDVLIGLITASTVLALVAIGVATYKTSTKERLFQAIQALKIFSLAVSILFFLLLCVSKLPFGGAKEFILVFVASILSIGFHSFDFATKSIQPTIRHVASELVVLLLYLVGTIMMTSEMSNDAADYRKWGSKCYGFPSGMDGFFGIYNPGRDICSFIETFISIGEFPGSELAQANIPRFCLRFQRYCTVCFGT
jgi:hypothetical protein